MNSSKVCCIYLYLKKSIILFLVCAILISSLCVNFSNIVLAANDVLEEYEKIAETQDLVLYCSMKTGNIAVKDKRNNYIWTSAVDQEVCDLSNSNDVWKTYMTSLFTISCIDKKEKETRENTYYPVSDGKIVEAARINNGISLNYDFTSLGIGLTLEIKLDGDSMTVCIPADKIQESENKGIKSIELMPFFGAADHTVDGYLLYPDGCGAITKYANVDQRSKNVKAFTWDIYGAEQVDFNECKQMEKDQKYQAMLPIYGIKNGDNAILAAVEKGAEDTSIKVSPDGFIVNLNRASFAFNYRHFYKINLSNIVVNGASVLRNTMGTRVDKEMIKTDREVRIFFLSGETANYSGMANTYREYLIKSNLLKKVIIENDNIPLALELFMGIKENRLLFDKYVTMTTFKNAISISEELKNAGVDSMQVMLKGWTKGGYGLYPVNWPPEKKLGGKKGLREFSDYARKNNMQIFMRNNFIQADSKNRGFSTRNDVVMQGSNLPVTGMGKTEFLFNPFFALQRFVSFFNEFSRWCSEGVALERIGINIYHDYNKANPAGRAETIEKWEDMLDTVIRNQRPAAVEGGNQYVLKYADRLCDIPVRSSQYNITDEEVPFYQMVVHGMIPYTSEAANLSYDLTMHKLKLVEYGCMPYFELTYSKSTNLNNTEYNKLFTSYYINWYKQAADIYNEFNERLKCVWSQKIIEHDKMEENTYRIRYSNGITVYVNYSKNDIECDGYSIKGKDYIVVGKGGVIN